MKRISILFLMLGIAMVIQAQNCVNCNNNTINPSNYASALGEDNTSTGLSSFAAGKLNTASGMYSMAV